MDEMILEHEALRLPLRKRVLLADALLRSLDDEASRVFQESWAREAEERLAAFHRGETTALDGPDVLKELRARHQR